MRYTFKALLLTLILGLFIMWPHLSFADWNGHGGNGQGHNSSGHSHDSGGHSHDSGGHGHDGGGHWNGGWHNYSYVGVNFSVWPDTYYYTAPYYPPDDSVIVSPPETVVEEQPVTVVQPPVVVDSQAQNAGPVITTLAGTSTPGAGDVDSITINIPNNKGGYTAVTLKRSGNGFIGPQGEFYPEFPKVAVLEVVYGK